MTFTIAPADHLADVSSMLAAKRIVAPAPVWSAHDSWVQGIFIGLVAGDDSQPVARIIVNGAIGLYTTSASPARLAITEPDMLPAPLRKKYEALRAEALLSDTTNEGTETVTEQSTTPTADLAVGMPVRIAFNTYKVGIITADKRDKHPANLKVQIRHRPVADFRHYEASQLMPCSPDELTPDLRKAYDELQAKLQASSASSATAVVTDGVQETGFASAADLPAELDSAEIIAELIAAQPVEEPTSDSGDEPLTGWEIGATEYPAALGHEATGDDTPQTPQPGDPLERGQGVLIPFHIPPHGVVEKRIVGNTYIVRMMHPNGDEKLTFCKDFYRSDLVPKPLYLLPEELQRAWSAFAGQETTVDTRDLLEPPTTDDDTAPITVIAAPVEIDSPTDWATDTRDSATRPEPVAPQWVTKTKTLLQHDMFTQGGRDTADAEIDEYKNKGWRVVFYGDLNFIPMGDGGLCRQVVLEYDEYQPTAPTETTTGAAASVPAQPSTGIDWEAELEKLAPIPLTDTPEPSLNRVVTGTVVNPGSTADRLAAALNAPITSFIREHTLDVALDTMNNKLDETRDRVFAETLAALPPAVQRPPLFLPSTL